MELITILLSGLLGILAPVGFVSDRIATNAIRDRFESAETLAVRIDNAPSYQILQGRIQRVRVAGRGLVPRPDLRIAALELETDAIALNPSTLRGGQPQLEQPLQAGVRLEITETDVNRFLQSKAIADRWQKINLNLPTQANQPPESYRIQNVTVDFLENDRVQVVVILKGQQSETRSQITAETGLSLTSGRQLELLNPQVNLNGTPIPSEVIGFLTAGVVQQLNLGRLDESGLTARVLNLAVNNDQLDLAAFVRVEQKFLDR
jgi:hypothetical protein